MLQRKIYQKLLQWKNNHIKSTLMICYFNTSIRMRKEGTKNYYYFDAEDGTFDKLMKTIGLAAEILSALPNRSGNE